MGKLKQMKHKKKLEIKQLQIQMKQFLKMNNNDNKFTIMRETIRSVQNAQNIVVVKTLPGMANAAATSLDTFAGEAIVGSIAGDDTIFIVVRNNEDAEEFTNYVKEVVSL